MDANRASETHERLEVLHDAAEIAAAVARLAVAIRLALAGARVFVIPVMNAGVFFAADLMRALAAPGRGRRPADPVLEGFGAACVSSYPRGTRAEGDPVLCAFPTADRVLGRTVLVVDTIVDSGKTARAVIEEARARGALDVRLACLLDKPARRAVPVRPDFCAFTAPDRFLVGYGLDVGGRHRFLPCIAALADAGGEGA